MFKNINESFEQKFKHLTESTTLNEGPTPFLLSADDINDPKEVNFKKIIKRNADAEAKAKAERERQEKIAAIKEKYKDVLNGIESMSTDDAIEKLHAALVPGSGIADTVAGELVRATMRILYRDYNDGDKFFAGYGLETCGGSAEYLHDMSVSPMIAEIIEDAYRYIDNDDAYTQAITQLAKDVIDHIVSNPELLAEPNETDSRDYRISFIEEHQPVFDYDFTLPYDVTKYLESGYVRERDIIDIVESNLDVNGIRYGSVECSGGDYVYIYDLDYDSYSEVESWKMWQDRYWEYEVSEWEDAYGDPDEDDEDDLDESKSLKESPSYEMAPQYDSRQSFYGKARVDINGDTQTLYSYNTPVAKIVGGKVELLDKWDWSQTTLRHVKEFLKQNGFAANSLAQMRKDYL